MSEEETKTSYEGIEDTFNGDDAHLIKCIEALILLSDEGVLIPYGLGGHARKLLAACYCRLSLKFKCKKCGEDNQVPF